jgi:hypothetical protein
MKYFCCVLIILFSFVLQIQAAEQGKNKIMAANGRNLVILIHGFSRGAEDMQFWKEHLSMENTDVLIPDLPTVFESFERCLEVLSDVIAAKEPEKYSAVYNRFSKLQLRKELAFGAYAFFRGAGEKGNIL